MEEPTNRPAGRGAVPSSDDGGGRPENQCPCVRASRSASRTSFSGERDTGSVDSRAEQLWALSVGARPGAYVRRVAVGVWGERGTVAVRKFICAPVSLAHERQWLAAEHRGVRRFFGAGSLGAAVSLSAPSSSPID